MSLIRQKEEKDVTLKMMVENHKLALQTMEKEHKRKEKRAEPAKKKDFGTGEQRWCRRHNSGCKGRTNSSFDDQVNPLAFVKRANEKRGEKN